MFSSLSPKERVFIECRHAVYRLDGFFTVSTIEPQKKRGRFICARTGDEYKVFENERGVWVVIEHAFDSHGASTWDSANGRYKWIYVPIELYRSVGATTNGADQSTARRTRG